jgi:hypothetical protein
MPNASGQFSLGTALSESLRYAVPGIGHVLKISWLILLIFIIVLAACVAILGGIFGIDDVTQTEEYSTGRILFQLLNFVISLAFSAALLTVFARDYVLEEAPPRLFATFGQVLVRTFLFTIAAMAVAFVVVFVLTFVAILLGAALGSAGGAAGFILGVLVFVALLYLFCRFVTWIVSAAIGAPQTLGEAWRTTAGATGWKVLGGFIVLFVLAIIVAIVFGVLSQFLFPVLADASTAVLISLAVVIGLAIIVVYLMFVAAITVYPATVIKQMI